MLAQSDCLSSIIKAYNEGKYSDLTISCGHMIFNVHKVVVCTRCAFFEKSAKFGKESEEKRIDLPEDDPEMIRRLIAYLYLDDYEPSSHTNISSFRNIRQPVSMMEEASIYHARYKKALLDTDSCACLALAIGAVQQKTEPRSASVSQDYILMERPEKSFEVAAPLSVHAAMYALGDKYDVDGLCQLAISKFDSCLHYHWNSEDFMEAVQIVYSSTPDTNRGLRDIVLKAFNLYFGINITQISGLEAKLHTIDELSFQLIKCWPKKEPVVPKSTQKSPVATPTLFGGSQTTFGNAQPSQPTFGFGRAPQQSAFGTNMFGRPQ